MNLQKASDPAIEGALGKALGATGAEQEAALKDLNAAITNSGWYIPVYEDFTYAGYNADKVAEPKCAGTNNYLVLSEHHAGELTRSLTGRWPRHPRGHRPTRPQPPPVDHPDEEPACSPTSPGGWRWRSARCSPPS